MTTDWTDETTPEIDEEREDLHPPYEEGIAEETNTEGESEEQADASVSLAKVAEGVDGSLPRESPKGPLGEDGSTEPTTSSHAQMPSRDVSGLIGFGDDEGSDVHPSAPEYEPAETDGDLHAEEGGEDEEAGRFSSLRGLFAQGGELQPRREPKREPLPQPEPEPLPEPDTPAAQIDLNDPGYFINRELSWLEFNRRVLAQALDEEVPMLERLKFLCISSTNLDEFFEVRVARLMQQVHMDAPRVGPDGMPPQEQLDRISEFAPEFVADQYRILNEVIIPGLAEEGIHFVRRTKWNEKQAEWVAD